MKRVIKFRQPIHKATGEFVSWAYWGFDAKGVFTNPASYSDGRPDPDSYQFTGLLDKNGVEIYEGDVVSNAVEITKRKRSGSATTVFFTGKYENTVAEVRWDDAWGQWDVTAKGQYQRGFLEVVGNIYENPDLLEQTK